MRYETFNEWKSLGLSVKKGEKSHKRNNKGEAVFSEQQVKSVDNPGDCDYELDDFYWMADPYFSQMGDR